MKTAGWELQKNLTPGRWEALYQVTSKKLRLFKKSINLHMMGISEFCFKNSLKFQHDGYFRNRVHQIPLIFGFGVNLMNSNSEIPIMI